MADAAKQAAFDKAVKDPVYMNDQGYMLYNPAVDSNTRCKRRWVDYQRIRADAVNAALSQSSHKDATTKAPFSAIELQKLMRERYLLYVQCVESKKGQEPQNPFLYPRYVSGSGTFPQSFPALLNPCRFS